MYQSSESPLLKLAASHQHFLQSSIGTDSPSPDTNGQSALIDASFLAQIPKATAINRELEAVGLNLLAARQVSDAYLKSADHLRNICKSSLWNALAKGHVSQGEAQILTNAWATSYARQTRVWTENAISCAREAVAKAKAASAPSVKEEKPVFNHEYTPFLEKYFEYNAYPSAPDRTVLARKSMMTPRQIEVWFQNHRNRAKKEGKVLRKLSEEPLPSEISLRSLEQEMPYFTIPVHQRKPITKTGLSEDDLSDTEDVRPSTTLLPAESLDSDVVKSNPLDPPRSPYAFPTVYVHRNKNCFVTQPGAHKFPPPDWYRKPAANSHSRLRIDMNDFVSEFNQKLHLRAPESKPRRPSVSQNWCSGRYVPWCPAPHPALVRSTRVSSMLPTLSAKPLPVIPVTISCCHGFRSPLSSTSISNTILNPSESPLATPMRHKVAGLPKRTPEHKSTAHRRGSSALSETSPEPTQSSSSSSSRSSSLTSSLSSRRPSPSSSSSSSSSPTTPVLASSSLPGYTDSSVISVCGVDFDYSDDLVANTRIASSVKKSFTASTTTQREERPVFDTPVTRSSRNHNLFRTHNSPS